MKPAYRGQHVGHQLIEALLAEERDTVYLECASHNETYYARFGFQAIPWQDAPMPLKLKSLVGSFFARLVGRRLVTMKRET